MKIQGSGGNKKKKASAPVQRAPIESPNTLISKNTARIIDLLCEGPIVGLVDGAKSIYFDDTALENSDGSRNFSGVTYESRVGEPDQNYLSGFPEVENEEQVGVELTYNNAVVRTISDTDTTSLRVKIRTPQFLSQNTSTGDIGSTSVQFQIEVQPFGGSYEIVELTNETSNPITISGKSSSPYEAAYRFDLPAGGAPWNVRITRLTADATTTAVADKIFWSTYTKIVDAKLMYMDSALVGLTIDRQQFGQELPTRAYDIKGLIIQVPSNYNPVTRVYTGIWDGTFSLAWTDNPAWVLYDILVNSRYGLGDNIDQDEIDKFEFYEIAQYCDELVDNGEGGTEPRFTINCVINSAREAYDIVNAIASNFRAMVYWSSGSVSVVQDKPEDTVKLVSPANIIGHFNYSSSALASRHSAALVSWNDPLDAYRLGIAVVEDPDTIDTFGWRQTDTVAFGCVSYGQATRYGKWILDIEKNELDTVTYECGLDHANVRPGNIVAVADPSYASVRFGGRILSSTLSQVIIDKEVDLSAGETYSVSLVLPDGTIAERTLTNTPGTTGVLTWVDPLPELPQAQTMWVITGTDVAPRLFRVISVREVEKHKFEVMGLFYDPTKYDRVESNLIVERPTYTQFPSGALEAPSNLNFTEYLYQSNSGVLSAINVSWEASSDPRAFYYELQVQGPNDVDFRPLNFVSGTAYDLKDNITGTYVFRVRAIDGLGGAKSAWAIGTYSAGGTAAPPSDVENFAISIVGSSAYLTWDRVTDLDLAYYVIRFSPNTTGVTWGSSTILFDRVPATQTSISVPAGIGTYSIKAVDTSGSYSENESLIVTNVGAILGLNVVETITEDPAFSGTGSFVEKVSNYIRLSPAETIDDWVNVDDIANWDLGEDPALAEEGTYSFAATLDLLGIYTSRITPSIVAYGTNIFSEIDDWPLLDDVTNIDGAEQSEWDVTLQLRKTNDDPNVTPVWSEWTNLIIGDYTARAFEFRAILKSFEYGVTPIVEGLSVTVDMPDRVIGQEDVIAYDYGTTITYDPEFKVAPAVAISAQGLATGDYYIIDNKDELGFNIQFFDSSDTPIQRTFDWVAKGYGATSTGVPIIGDTSLSADFEDADNSLYVPILI